MYQVVASDPDDGFNGEVTYSLFGHEAKRWFEIDSTTGMDRFPIRVHEKA